jgi:hypothetical protein
MVDISKAIFQGKSSTGLPASVLITAYDGLAAFSDECRKKQIKVLLSPILVAKSRHTASHLPKAPQAGSAPPSVV